MIVSRWQAESFPSKQILLLIIENEGIDASPELFPAATKIAEHRHPYTEIRVIVTGELMFNISGNQFLLRAGDRVEIPANTRHSYSNNAATPCESLVGYKTI